MNPYSLEGMRVLIAGASSGIGYATALACAQLGATVVALARNQQRLQALIHTLGGGEHQAFVCDLCNPEQTAQMCGQLGRLDGAVMSVGTLETVPTRFIDSEMLYAQFDVNFIAIANMMAQMLQQKNLAKDASVVMISSVAATAAAEPGNAIYSASKGALEAYSRVLALELASRRIRVNCIAPGIVRTPFLSHFQAEEAELRENEKKYPLGFGEPEDVAYAATYLLSPAAKWVTGTTLRIDGGLTL